MIRSHGFRLLLLFVAILAAACARLPEEGVATGTVTFTASMDPSSRTVLVAGNEVEWVAGDAISLFDGETNREVATPDSGPTATFTTELSAAGPWYALYPYDADASVSGAVIRSELPAAQTAVEGTFGPGQNISVARSAGALLFFKNVLSYIKFVPGRSDIVSVTFAGNDGETVAGGIDIDYNDGIPSWSAVSPVKQVTLSSPSGCLKAGKSYYIAILPQTFEKGVSLTFTSKDGLSLSVSTSETVTCPRSILLNVGTPDGRIDFDDIILFADEEVEADLTAHLASRGYPLTPDGKLTRKVAATVTYADLASLSWSDPSAVDTFDELRWFTGLSDGGKYTLPPLFTDCTALTSVLLPENLTLIAPSAFKNCSSLASISLPPRLSRLYNSIFYGCSSLRSVVIPDGVTALSSYAFYGCTTLERVVLPASLTAIGDYDFMGCSSLLSCAPADQPVNCLMLPSGVRTVGKYAFRSCSLLSIRRDSFTSSALETIGDRAFFAVGSAVNLVLPATVTSISARAFENSAMGQLTLLSATPPAIPAANEGADTDIFSGGTTPVIYVPDAAAYRNDPDWAQYEAQISDGSPFDVPSGVQVRGNLIDVRKVAQGQKAFPQNDDCLFGSDIVAIFGPVSCADSHKERRGVTQVKCSAGSPVIACPAASLSGWSYTGKKFSLAGATWYVHRRTGYTAGSWVDVPYDTQWGFCPLVFGDGIEVEGTRQYGVLISQVRKLRSGTISNACITLLPDGSYLAACSGAREQAGLVLFRSTDKGATWSKYGNYDSSVNLIENYTNLFVLDGVIYLMGVAADRNGFRIAKSIDGGKNWTVPATAATGLLLEGTYHTGQCPVAIADGRIWRACETYNEEDDAKKPFMISAPLDSDLLNAASWTQTNIVTNTSYYIGTERISSMIEGNAVVGPDGKVVNVIRSNCATSSNHATILHTKGTKTLSYDPTTDHVVMPGGGKRFTIRHDPVSGLYWSLTNPHFDETVTNDGIYAQGLPNSLKRNRLVLISSPDLRTWTEHRTVLYNEDPFFHGFQYVDFVIDGQDLAAVVRAAYPETRGLPNRQHDANKFLFVKVIDFRTENPFSRNESFTEKPYIL